MLQHKRKDQLILVLFFANLDSSLYDGRREVLVEFPGRGTHATSLKGQLESLRSIIY